MPENPLSRRDFLATTAVGLAGYAAGGAGGAGGADEPLVHVGTYTEGGRRDGVYRFRMNRVDGTLRPAGAAAAGDNPSFLAMHPTRGFLYAVNEVTEYGGEPSGAVSAFAVDPGTGQLTLLNRQSSRGGAPCYVSVDDTGRFALVANYVGGSVAVLPIAEDGRLGEAAAVVQHRGSGPNAKRQKGPHAHCVILDPSNRFALAADLGIDRIMVYRFDARAGTLTPAAVPFAALPPGAGPRHLAFHPTGRVLYVVNELDLTLGVFGYDAATGALTAVQMLPILSERPAGEAIAADLHVLPSGRFLYASVRGDDSIAVFAVDQGAGTLTPVQRVSTSGDWPRNFAIDPTGRFLLVANQRSNTIVGFHVDPATGRLAETGQRLEVPAPVCIRFDGQPSR